MSGLICQTVGLLMPLVKVTKGMKPLDRFKAKYEISPSGCWEWKASRLRGGYGAFALRSHSETKAHRASYILHVGLIPEGKCVLHVCDNRLCVNPEHLFLGNRGDNNRDRAQKGRSFRPCGELSPSAKLTEILVEEIRHAKGFQSEIAKRYGINQSQVSRIRSGARWSHSR